MANSQIIIPLIILLFLFIIFFILGIIFFIKKNYFKKKDSTQNIQNNNKDEYFEKLQQLSNISSKEAVEIYVSEIKEQISSQKALEIKEWKNKSKAEINEIGAQILIDSIEQLAEDISKKSISYLKVDEALKGKLIGKEGRNIKVFEKITGADLLIEKDEMVSISCFNPFRRELAFKLLKRLVKSKSIEPSKIEKYYLEEKNDFEKATIEIGKDTIENVLKIEKYIPKSLYFNVGKLFYRTSYTQNILNHLIECAKIASTIAKHLKLDQTKAKASAFIHDIGKSQDYEEDNDHVKTGYNLAIANNLDEFLINSILSHHENEPVNSIYSAITKVSDTISAARPGARRISQLDFEKRMQTLEALALEIEGVNKVYAIRSGKEIRVITNEDIGDYKIKLIADTLKKKYENDDLCSIRPIDIIVIKEKRESIRTKSSGPRFN